MGNLYMMTTIVDRKIASSYAKLYQENQLNVMFLSLGYGTVSNETMMDELASGELGLINKVVNADSIMNGLGLVGEGEAQMSSYARVGYSFISFNCEKPAVASQAVRQAMAWCLDKDTLVSDYVGNFGLRVDGYYGIGQWMYQVLTGALIPEVEEPEAGASAEEKKAYEDTLKGWEELTMENIPVYNLDIDKANQLLNDDGWTLNQNGEAFQPGVDTVRCKKVDGELVALDLEMIYPEGNTIVDSLQVTFVDNLKLVGIQVKMTPVPMAELLTQYYRQDARDCDMIYLATNFSEVFDPTLTYAPVDGINSNYAYIEDEKLFDLFTFDFMKKHKVVPISYDKNGGIITELDGNVYSLTGKEPVSMNFFGFSMKAFEEFHVYWDNFKKTSIVRA